MENVFDFRNQLVEEYSAFSRSFAKISAPDIKNTVTKEYDAGRYWPQPLIQINPNYHRDTSVQQLAENGTLHPLCSEIFRTGKTEGRSGELTLFKHQLEALAKGQAKQSYVVTTGAGSGKSLSFFIPVVDAVLKGKAQDPKQRTRAIVIYPMNALANSQLEELDKFLHGMQPQPFTVARYTGQEKAEERQRIADNPPDILLTNFMMLELILTRYEDIDRRVVENYTGLKFPILDKLHTYRNLQNNLMLLYGSHFCRDCGLEYYPVWKSENNSISFTPREISETLHVLKNKELREHNEYRSQRLVLEAWDHEKLKGFN